MGFCEVFINNMFRGHAFRARKPCKFEGCARVLRAKWPGFQATAQDSQPCLLLAALQTCHSGLRKAWEGDLAPRTFVLKRLKPATFARGQLL